MRESGTKVTLRLREILEERGMTQKELALRSGLSENAISKLARGPAQVNLDTINAICNTLQIEPGELIIRE